MCIRDRNFYGMPGKIEGMTDLEAGADFLGSERSYDIALITVFEDRASFDAYQTHPVHMPVKKRMHEVRSLSLIHSYLESSEDAAGAEAAQSVTLYFPSEAGTVVVPVTRMVYSLSLIHI